jgi:predicted signal transduction protein with EAL and GGDEF domain
VQPSWKVVLEPSAASDWVYADQGKFGCLDFELELEPELEPEPRAQALVEGVIQLAHKLGYTEVKEGIETEAERQMLLKLGCDQVQGYLLAKPMPIAETSV